MEVKGCIILLVGGGIINSDKRFKYEDVKKYVESLGLKLLSTEYKNMRTKLKFKCKCGNEFERDLSGIKYKNRHTCNECSYIESRSSYMKPLEDVVELCEESGLIYIDRYVKDNTRSTVLLVELDKFYYKDCGKYII